MLRFANILEDADQCMTILTTVMTTLSSLRRSSVSMLIKDRLVNFTKNHTILWPIQ